MTLSEKIAYIKGLTDGLKLDSEKDEVKVINALVDLLEDMTVKVAELDSALENTMAQVDEIDDSLAEVEEFVFEDDCFDCCDDDCDCDDCCDCDDDENVFYEVTCPSCGNDINVEEEILLCGETACPNCGEILEFDFSTLFDEDEDCDCGCGCHHDCDCDCDHTEDAE